jgi:hypothetical protein
LTQAGFLLSGEPNIVIATLLTYAESHDQLGTSIYADELRKFLFSQNIYPKSLVYDNRIAPTIERLQSEFNESITPGLINGELIPRIETVECINALETDGMVILHGPAGSGKSGVLYELSRKLQEMDIIWLPLRLDRRIPQNNVAQYGSFDNG